MKIYLVGGAVRDEILGYPIKDRDYVVVGSTPEEMISLGYEQVGSDFPVFLHPVSNEEYALARTERKVGKGYHGFETNFDPSITLEEDLYRRDITINAMARDMDTGALIDPFNGFNDLMYMKLKHVSEHFAEDPIRVLRVARFNAKDKDFMIHSSTFSLMQKLVNDGELDNVTPERIYLEFEKGLSQPVPAKFISVLIACGAWERLFPGINESCDLFHLRNTNFLNNGASYGFELHQMFGLLTYNLNPNELEKLLTKIKAPNHIHRFCTQMQKVKVWENGKDINAQNTLELLMDIGAFKDKNIVQDIIRTHRAFFKSAPENIVFNDLLEAYHMTKNVSFNNLTPKEQTTLKGNEISLTIKQRRIELLENFL